MGATTTMAAREDLYQDAANTYGPALERLARAYEADPDHRRDLLQEIHLALWRSFEGFDGRCSVRTWTYRVAHNAATSHVIRQKRTSLIGLEDLEAKAVTSAPTLDRNVDLSRLLDLVRALKPPDRQVMLSYLEGMDAAAIGEITGLAPGNVATKIHRIKTILKQRFQQGGQHAE